MGPDAAHSSEGFFVSLPGWVQALATLLAVAAIVVAGRYLVRPVMDFHRRHKDPRDLLRRLPLFSHRGIALGMQSIGLSPALGTFLAGVVLAESEYRHQLENRHRTVQGPPAGPVLHFCGNVD